MTRDLSNLGQDAFLDIVANLVGILIILVVIVGAQAAAAWNQSDDTSEMATEVEELKSTADKSQSELLNLRHETKELRRKIAEENAITNRLAQLRRRLLVNLESARRMVEEKKSALDQQHRASVIATAQVESLRKQIEQVRFESAAAQQQLKPLVETVKHYPTPIARTVFSDEIHFRILGGRIVHVPLEQLVNQMKNEWRLKAEKLRSAENTWETVGPIENFRLQYALDVVTEDGPNPQYGIQLKRFLLQPVRDGVGETIATAIQSGSNLQSRLARMIPEKTTVSLWVYPDDYDDLSIVRKWLRDSGFQTASWPLEYGSLISGGPQGFRTTSN